MKTYHSEFPKGLLPPAPTPKGEAPTEPVFEKPYFDAHEKGREGEEKVSAILQHMGWPALHNVILEDGGFEEPLIDFPSA
ncbi:hypothetical protein A4S02_01485 [Acetobacter ascendens]|uniref:Uncharacterized protein n=1 Tax=Acetobacter ascendens TaxID=481146 RepID=A0A1D8QTI9_9PROT|nr:NERD domain-containing protein [Acetobacter ascendens]AOW45642.1 hypothetical protein A4S02_01485 [Acetobacter ascendens]